VREGPVTSLLLYVHALNIALLQGLSHLGLYGTFSPVIIKISLLYAMKRSWQCAIKERKYVKWNASDAVRLSVDLLCCSLMRLRRQLLSFDFYIAKFKITTDEYWCGSSFGFSKKNNVAPCGSHSANLVFMKSQTQIFIFLY
jgi:hypothetical protein